MKLYPSQGSLHFLVDITNRCNLRCAMCHFALDEVFRRRATHMSAEAFELIAKELRPYARKLTLSAAYEPSVSPYFRDVLGVVLKLGFPETNYLTNGQLMPAADAEAIVRAGISEVGVSIHAARPETYARILGGGQLERMAENLHRLQALRRAMGSTTPELHVNVALMRSNLEEFPEIIELAARLGSRSLSFRHVIVFEGLAMELETLSAHDPRLVNEWIQLGLERARKLGVAIHSSPDYFATPDFDASRQAVDWHESSYKHRIRSLRSLLRRARGAVSRQRSSIVVGNIDEPGPNEVVRSRDIRLSGWALARSGIRRVAVYRDSCGSDRGPFARGPHGSLVLLGSARFRNGTRPDVVSRYSDWEYSYRAGWDFRSLGCRIPAEQRDACTIEVQVESTSGERSTLGRRSFVIDKEASEGSSPYCSKPFDSLYVDAHGHVYPYPDCHTEFSLGQLPANSFTSIWNGKALAGLRARILAEDPPGMCRRCPIFINRRVDDGLVFSAHRDFSSEERR